MISIFPALGPSSRRHSVDISSIARGCRRRILVAKERSPAVSAGAGREQICCGSHMADGAYEQLAGEADPAPKLMRAVTLTGYGGIRMVKVTKEPEVTAKEGQVLIRVKAW